jgi:hypothetical protein
MYQAYDAAAGSSDSPSPFYGRLKRPQNPRTRISGLSALLLSIHRILAFTPLEKEKEPEKTIKTMNE